MNILRCACAISFGSIALAQPAAIHPPAVPLITHDPYFSAWSMSEKLTDNWPRHWSGGTLGMSGLVWVDGKAYRWCGPMPQGVPAAEQKSVSIDTTTTAFTFLAGGTDLIVSFALPRGTACDLAKASQSVTAITFSATANDGKPHEVRVYLDVTGEWCSNDSGDQVSWSRHKVAGMDVLSMGRVEQPVLAHSGDQRKIDWGRVYLAGGDEAAAAGHLTARTRFATTGHACESDDLRMPRAANDDWPVLSAVVDLGGVAGNLSSGHLLIAYDEGEAIELFGRRLRPLWAANAPGGMADLLTRQEKEWLKSNPVNLFDKDGRIKRLVDPVGTPDSEDTLETDAQAVGGRRYANLLRLAFRQVMAGHKIVADWDGTPMMFSKENTSNGCMATVDVIYPACPFFLYHNPAMLRAQLLPLMQYSASPRWKFPFAPHDMGQYPKANGQVYGGGERTEADQMPVEESGNMLIMLAALAKVDQQESVKFCEPYWPTMEKWAVYLKDNGLDPANQLCTDDFAGHLARNVNLSAKTVVALGGYAQLLRAAGRSADADRWQAIAQDYAKKWIETAKHGEATSLVFGDTGKNTWSQKYNLIWDRVLGLGLFPQGVFDKETALYRTKLQKYGLPLDSRRTYTKLDWTCWSACLSGKGEDFDAIMAPVLDWANATPPPSRVPLSDWYETTDGKTMGMHTRTVVGGLWMPLLIDKLKAPQK